MMGRYRVLDPLGRGAMGSVVRAFDPELGRLVAIKTLHNEGIETVAGQAQARRFVAEARSVARLRHPGIVAVYDVGRHDDGAYMVMECVQGLNLRQCLTEGVRFSVAGVLHLVGEVLAALQHAHDQQILHRDVKPENILVDWQGHVKLTDFGIAKVLDAEGQQATLMDGQLIGTPRYMAPEQLRGEGLDARCDVFACGVLLYELLASRPPFGGQHMAEVVQNILNQEPPPLAAVNPAVSTELAAVVHRALCKSADQRWGSAEALRMALMAEGDRLSEEAVAPQSLDPSRLESWAQPASRERLAQLLAGVKTVNPQDCVLSDGVPAMGSTPTDVVLDAGSTGGSDAGDAGWRITQPVRTWPLGVWAWWRRAWRSRTVGLVLVLIAGVLWLLTRPVPPAVVPGAVTAAAPAVALVESLAPDEQWVPPPAEQVSLTMDREMKTPADRGPVKSPVAPSGAGVAGTPTAAGARSEAVPRVERSESPTPSPAATTAPPDRVEGVTVESAPPPVPQPPREPCTGMGFFERERCLWRECDTDRFRRHPVCARFR